MKPRTTFWLGLAGAAVVSMTALFTPGCTCGPEAGRMAPAKVERVSYHGWSGALRLFTPEAEVVVVPEIGRVMSFRLSSGENVLWEDRSLDGKGGNPNGNEWINFGGDKTWPAPEADWGKYTGRKEWMPPAAFDSLPVTATIEGGAVVMTSPVDPHYGIRTIRRVQLFGSQMNITTAYERVSGEPAKIGVWVITQFKHPAAVVVPVKPNSLFPDGHYKFGPEPWPQLERKQDRIVIQRDPKQPHKMGSDARQLLWIGERETCVVSTWSQGNEYPDRGASAEVYTNPDPKTYVELETLGPLSLMKAGDRISNSQSYLLRPRAGASLEQSFRLVH